MTLVAALSCDANVLPMFKALETEHFLVYRQHGLPAACEEVGVALEAHFRAYQAYLNVSPGRIGYRHYFDLNDARRACRGVAPNCYLPEARTVVSVSAVYPHEIAHAFEIALGGPARAPGFFSEGFASALGGGFAVTRLDRRVDTSLPIEELVDDGAFWPYLRDRGPGDLYGTAAGFVTFIMNTFGKEKYLAFHAALDGVTKRAEIERIYLAIFASSFVDGVTAWRAAAQPILDDLLLVHPGCDELPLPATGEVTEIGAGCGTRSFSFEVPSTGRLDLSLTGSNSILRFVGCGRGDAIPGSGLVLDGSTRDYRVAFDVPPGKYMGIAIGGRLQVAVAPDPVTVDTEGVCHQDRTPVVLDAASKNSFVYIRRWGDVEKQVMFDIQVRSSGALEIASASGAGVTDVSTTAPRVYFLCPQPCPADANSACVRDDIFQLQTQVDPSADVFSARLLDGELRHFGTEARYFQDWGYSVRLRLQP